MYASIDIGGTKTKIGISKDLRQFYDIQKFTTPKTFQELKSKVESILKSKETYEAISIGAAGFVNRKEKRIYYAPHAVFLNNKLAEEIVSNIKYKSIFLENDATLAALAEATHGEGKNYSRVAYITISTGVGGSIIVNRKIPDTIFNFEPGHHVLNFETNQTFESLCSGTAFRKKYGVSPEEHDNEEIWSEFGKNLGFGLHNIILLWRPDIIIIGGSLSKKSHLFLQKTKNTLTSLQPFKSYPNIEISQLGDENGIIGGLELISSIKGGLSE